MKYRLLVLTIGFLIVCSSFVQGALISSNAVVGDWTAPGSWFGGIVPGAGDDVIIVNGAVISVNLDASCLSLTLNGTATLGFPTNARTLTVFGTMTMNGTSQVTGNNNNRILDLQGDFNIPAGQTGSIGGVRVAQVITGTFNLGGTFTPTDNTGTKTFGNANFFNGCFLDAGVTENIIIAGTLVVQPTIPGLQARIGRIGMTVAGTTTVIGYLEFRNSNAGVKTFNGTITVAVGATWDNIVGEDPVINCDIINNGLWPVPTGGNGRYNVVNAIGNYSYSGNNEIGMTRLRIRNGATVTNNAILRLTKTASQGLSVESGSTFINGATGYLRLQSAPIPVDINGVGSSVNFSTAGNTVEYLFAGNQNIHPTTYHHLTSSLGGTKTINGLTTANNGLVTINDNTLVDVTGGTDLNGTASLIMNGTSSLQISSAGTVPALTGASHILAAGTTIRLNRAGAQTAASSASYAYRNLTINGNAGSDVNMAAVSLVQENLAFTGAGSMSSNPVLTVNGAFNYGSSASTTLAANLLVSNFIASSGLINYSGRTISVFGDNGTWTNNGCAFTTSNTSIVSFITGLNQSIGGTAATTFANLNVGNPNDVTMNSNATATEFLTFASGSGNLVTGTNTMILTALAANVTRTAPNPGFVEGRLRKSASAGFASLTFEVGTGSRYTPLNATFTGVVGTGDVTVSSEGNDSPDIFSALIQPDKSVNRIWSMTNNTLTFTSVNVTMNFVPLPGGDPDPGTDVTNSNLMIIKGFNNSTLTWFSTPTVPAPVFLTNSSAFSGLAAANLPAGQQVDFQIGEVINPTFVFNRLTGAGLLWSNPTTWIQVRSGVISIDISGNVVGTPGTTKFLSELVDNDQIMFLGSPGVVYTVVPGSITDDENMNVSPFPGVPIGPLPFGRQYVPGINSPVSDVDAVSIGNTSTADALTTITLDVSAQVLIINIGASSKAAAHSLTHQNSTRTLRVLANATVSQPASVPAGAVNNDWNINDATADVAGDVTIGSAGINTKVSRINITTGILSAGNLRFRPGNVGGGQAQTVLNITSTGTVNLHGALTFNGNRGTLNSAIGSTFNFDRTASGQNIIVPAGSAAAWVYHNVHSNNTSAVGATFSFTSTATSLTGNVRVQTGIMKLASFNLVGDPARTFEVANGAVFEMTSASAAGVGGFPSGFGTFTLGPTSTVAYNQTGNTNPWPVSARSYGNLIIGQYASAAILRNFALANATTNVLGNLTIGTVTSRPTLQGTVASTLNVTGNLLINAVSALNATNIADINLGGNWTDNGTFTRGTNTVTFTSPAANVLQTIGGTVTETFHNLTLNTSASNDIIRISNNARVSNTLTLTLGELDLNNQTLFIDRSATGAIVRTSGYIKSEDIGAPYGTVSWFIDNTTGAYQYPFGKSPSEFIPFIFNVTGAGNKGVGSGYVGASTYATAATNPPGEYPATVTNLNGTSGGASVTDRYWVITLGTPEYATTRPTATVTFTALNTEKPTTWTALGEPPGNPNFLLAQRWSLSGYWDPAQVIPAQTYANNTPAAGTFQVAVPALSSFSPWTIADSSVPLPVELVEFTAVPENGRVVIRWKTETELNNDFFLVQKTRDAEQFEDVVVVKGAGTTTNPKSYAVFDYKPSPGKSYYRLKQTDFDGQFSYSKLVAVDISESLLWKIYPNPAIGSEVTIALSLNDIGKRAAVKIQDMNGKELVFLSTDRLESPEIKVVMSEKLPPGIYVISIAIDQQVSRQKLIVR